MVSKDGGEEAFMELVFARENDINQQEKVKAFWKFLDAQNNLQPHKGTSEDEMEPPRTELSVSSVEKISEEKDVWRKGLEVFQRLGLDQTALAADNRCKLCLVEKTIRCDDLADTVTQSYEELNADMKAFEQREESRSLNKSETLNVSGTSKRCSADDAETRK